MELFQSDQVPLIILNSETGGTSVSLHDMRDRWLRYSIISLCWNAVTFKQVLERIHRVGAHGPVVQRVVLIDGTVEADIGPETEGQIREHKMHQRCGHRERRPGINGFDNVVISARVSPIRDAGERSTTVLLNFQIFPQIFEISFDLF